MQTKPNQAPDCVKTRFFGNAPQQTQYLTPSKMSKFGVFTQSGAAPGGLQRSLLRRSRFGLQVSAGVTRLWSLADAVAYRALEEWRSSSRTMSRRRSIPHHLTKEADHGHVHQSVEIY